MSMRANSVAIIVLAGVAWAAFILRCGGRGGETATPVDGGVSGADGATGDAGVASSDGARLDSGGAGPGAADGGAPVLTAPACTNCDGGWCRIDPGTFTMGAPANAPTRAAVAEDQVTVTLTHAFEVSQDEVTIAE